MGNEDFSDEQNSGFLPLNGHSASPLFRAEDPIVYPQLEYGDIKEEITIHLSAETFDAFSEALDKPMPCVTIELIESKPIWTY